MDWWSCLSQVFPEDSGDDYESTENTSFLTGYYLSTESQLLDKIDFFLIFNICDISIPEAYEAVLSILNEINCASL